MSAGAGASWQSDGLDQNRTSLEIFSPRSRIYDKPFIVVDLQTHVFNRHRCSSWWSLKCCNIIQIALNSCWKLQICVHCLLEGRVAESSPDGTQRAQKVMCYTCLSGSEESTQNHNRRTQSFHCFRDFCWIQCWSSALNSSWSFYADSAFRLFFLIL